MQSNSDTDTTSNLREETLSFFDNRLDNFSALVIYLSLVAMAGKSELWVEFHDENLLFKRDDFLKPAQSRVFAKVKAMGGEHRRLAEILEKACLNSPSACPHLSDLVSAKSKLPAWMVAPVGAVVQTRTREVSPSQVSQASGPPNHASQVATSRSSSPATQTSTAPIPTAPPVAVTPPDWGLAFGRVLGKHSDFSLLRSFYGGAVGSSARVNICCHWRSQG